MYKAAPPDEVVLADYDRLSRFRAQVASGEAATQQQYSHGFKVR